MARASEADFQALHGALTTELVNRVSKGEDCPTADLRLAADWLIKNHFTGVASPGTPLKALLEGLTDADQDFVERLTA